MRLALPPPNGRRLSRVFIIAGFAGAVTIACLSPTQLTLELRTDLPCSSVKGVTIAVGDPASVEKAPPGTTTLQCANGLIGTIAVSPAGEKNGRIGIRAVLGVDVPAEDCTAENKYKGCIVVRRQLTFIPRSTQLVAIRFHGACIDVPCDENSTCKGRNQCVPSTDDPGTPDAGSVFGDGGVPECDVKESCPTLPTTPAGCAEPRCEDHRCVYQAKDEDHDFDLAATCTSNAAGIQVAVGTDCDDSDPKIRGGLARECTTGPNGEALSFPPEPLMGACKKGKQSCDPNGKPGACVGAVGKVAETCGDGLDNDCNGAVDDGCACSPNGATQPCGSAVGACTPGTQTCTSSTWGTCVGATGPFARNCASTADNDCNGKADATQDCVCRIGDQMACSTGLPGVCAAGTTTCVADGTPSASKWGPCVSTGAKPFDCTNGLDNDCNGVVDADEFVTLQPPDNSFVCANLYRCPNGNPRRMPICRKSGTYTNDCGVVAVGSADLVGFAPVSTTAIPVGGGTIAPLYFTLARTHIFPRGVATKCCPANGACSGVQVCDPAALSTCAYTSLPVP